MWKQNPTLLWTDPSHDLGNQSGPSHMIPSMATFDDVKRVNRLRSACVHVKKKPHPAISMRSHPSHDLHGDHTHRSYMIPSMTNFDDVKGLIAFKSAWVYMYNETNPTLLLTDTSHDLHGNQVTWFPPWQPLMVEILACVQGSLTNITHWSPQPFPPHSLKPCLHQDFSLLSLYLYQLVFPTLSLRLLASPSHSHYSLSLPFTCLSTHHVVLHIYINIYNRSSTVNFKGNPHTL